MPQGATPLRDGESILNACRFGAARRRLGPPASCRPRREAPLKRPGRKVGCARFQGTANRLVVVDRQDAGGPSCGFDALQTHTCTVSTEVAPNLQRQHPRPVFRPVYRKVISAIAQLPPRVRKSHPFRAGIRTPKPRALPWAVVSRPFGAWIGITLNPSYLILKTENLKLVQRMA